MIKNCIICNSKFTNINNKKTCSIRCKRKLRLYYEQTKYNAKRRQRYESRRVIYNKKCVICLSGFTTPFSHQKACSEHCSLALDAMRKRLRYKQRRYKLSLDAKIKREINKIIIKCRVCGSPFRKIRYQKTCSLECGSVYKKGCREKYYRDNLEKINKQSTQWRKKNPEKRKQIQKRHYELGPVQPKGELGWLRKCNAMVRTASRITRKLSQGVSLSSSEASLLASNFSMQLPPPSRM